ncbi:MAG: hypothetical protein JNN28_11150 [Saprospiraceae bacterium]|nr:hypothetical protein [Saprospiraceae bacterium]
MNLRAPIILLAFTLASSLQAQCNNFSEGKDLYQLQLAIKTAKWSKAEIYHNIHKPNYTQPKSGYHPVSVLFLPKWSADNLPYFCRIEHNWAKHHHIPLKFRLGSVEYVDWLEGK